MAVNFNGHDVVIDFHENPSNVAAAQYRIEYDCATSTVTHFVPVTAFAATDSNGYRHYVDSLTYEENRSAGLTRTPTIRLYSADADGNWSDPYTLSAQNSLPVLTSTPFVTGTVDGVQVSLSTPNDTDFAGYKAWVSATTPVPMDSDHEVFNGNANTFNVKLDDDATYYLCVCPYDAFGLDTSVVSATQTIKRGLRDIGTLDPVAAGVIDTTTRVTALQAANAELARIRDRGLQFAGPQGEDAHTLIRRNTFVLDGLAPNVDSVVLATAQAAANNELSRIRDRALFFMGPMGEDAHTLIRRETTQREDAVGGLTETLELIGTKSTDGTAFILSDNSCLVAKDVAGSTQYVSVSARFADNEAAIENTNQAFADAQSSFAETMGLLGAKTSDGTAFLLSDSTVVVNKDVAGTTEQVSVASRFAENEGAIDTINQVFSDGTGTVARALLRVNADGHIIGFAATNDGHLGTFVITADQFSVVDPTTSDPLFFVSGDQAYLHNVKVDTLHINSVGYDQLQMGSAQKSAWTTLSSDVVIAEYATATVASMAFHKEDTDSALKIQMFLNVSSPDDLQLDVSILVDGVALPGVPGINIILDGTSSNGRMTLTPFTFATGIAPGDHTISVTVYNRENDPLNLTVAAGSTLEVTELRKASIGSTDGSGGAVIPPTPPTPTDPEPTPTDPGGGYHGNCVTDDTPILMANDDRSGPGDEKPAANVVVGDWVWTQHEVTGEWGAYEVVGSSYATERVFKAYGYPRATAAHRFRASFDTFWTRMDTIGVPAGMARVWRGTVADAHTYVSAGILSHNIKEVDSGTA